MGDFQFTIDVEDKQIRCFTNLLSVKHFVYLLTINVQKRTKKTNCDGGNLKKRLWTGIVDETISLIRKAEAFRLMVPFKKHFQSRMSSYTKMFSKDQ